MNLRSSLLALALLATATLAAVGQDRGYWLASSHDAKAITGDLQISETRFTLNFSSFTISRIRDLKPTEASALFDPEPGIPGNGFLYRTHVPAATRLLRNNSLCGSDDVEWMAVYVSGRTLKTVFFSGLDEPMLTFEALNNSTGVCGHFTYMR